MEKVAGMERIIHTIFGLKIWRKGPCRKYRRKWYDDIKRDFKNRVSSPGTDFFGRRDKDWWGAVLKVKCGNFLS